MLDLDKDPVPGDPERVKKLARELHDFAEDVGTALRQIKNMASEDAVQKWSGKSAKKFKEQFDGVPGNLKKLRTSYDLAGDAIAAYWPKLERAQTLSNKALAKGREARQDLTAAQGRLDTAQDWVKTATAKTEKYDTAKGADKPDEAQVRAATRKAHDATTARNNAQGAVDTAQNALDAAKAMAQEAKEIREEAARICKDKLEDASDAGIQNRSWWEEGLDFVSDNWDAIVTVCKVIVAVVGIIAMIVGGPILAAIVVVAAIIVLADTLTKYANGQATLWDVGFAALDCIPGLKGLTTLAGAAKGLKGAAAALRSGGLRGALRGGMNLLKKSKPALGRCKNGDPIDMVSGEMIMEGTDVALPGVLPLVIERIHISSYRWGRSFGPSWASTLDQRVELDAEGAVFATEDGMLLSYPTPEPGRPVMPVAGPRWPLEWDGTPGDAVTILDPGSGLTRRFAAPPAVAEEDGHFDAEGQVTLLLQSITDRNGNEITFAYDEAGMPAAVQHSGGYRIAVDTTDNRVTGLRLLNTDDGPDGTQLLRYSYDGESLAEIYNSSGRPLQLTYDDDSRITSWTDRNGSWYRFTYDAEDRCIAGEGSDGILSCTIRYDTDSNTTRYTNSLGSTVTYRYNELLQLVSTTNALGKSVTNEWDSDNRLLSHSDALGHTTSYTYDTGGNISRITRADGSATEVAYDDHGLPRRTVDANGAVWSREYDSHGNLTALTDPAGATTGYTYTSGGHLSAVTDALGNTTHVECSPAGLPVQVTDPLGATTRYARDAFGRPRSVIDPNEGVTSLEWTVEGRPARQQRPDGAVESWTYDGEGNCTAHTDALGQTTSFEYLHFDLLTARTDPDGTRHTFSHDRELRLTKVTNPQGLTWDYVYDPAGRLAAETDFDDRTIAYGRDDAGRTITRTTPLGDTIRFTHDPLGRITEKESAGLITRYAYDSAGRLRRAAGSDHELTMAYDQAGRLVQETTDGRTVRHDYDALGRRTKRVTPTGTTTAYAYDAAGNRTTVTTGGHTLTSAHDGIGRELLRTLDSGALTLAYAWDEAGRLTETALANRDAALRTRAFVYRDDGYLAAQEDSRDGPRRYRLDPAGRVTAVTARDWSETYAYDSAGNQTAATWPDAHPEAEARGERTYNGTRITSAGSIRYEHDAAGRLALRQKTRLSSKPDTWRYTWDAEDRLTQVTTPDGTHWRYTYDPMGRRTAKLRMAADGTTVAEQTTFTWDGSTLIEQTTTAPGVLPHPVITTWEYADLHPIAQTERRLDVATQEEIDARFFAIATDLAGTPTELIDESGELAWHTRATLWGSTTWSRHSTAYTPLRFPGQYNDPETGLHYNLHRHYDPATGRYASPDPLGLEPALNPMAYVHNPHLWADPLGLAPCTVTVYRKQSDHPLSQRVKIGPNGEVSITGKGHLYVNMSGDIRHTRDFRSAEEGYQEIVAFDVPKSYVDQIRRTAVPQQNPPGLGFTDDEWRQMKKISPEISDPTKGDDLYGIPRSMLPELRDAIIPGSGRVVESG
ncbi:RHS repeat-associated core domain-containing protein [Streptomyces boninensis]|uniref:RHS repeat-associated core domain-containing protein n=1 Tax=Streptomyces boninensis TaxID=2039455 RepID=UPI003B226662